MSDIEDFNYETEEDVELWLSEYHYALDNEPTLFKVWGRVCRFFGHLPEKKHAVAYADRAVTQQKRAISVDERISQLDQRVRQIEIEIIRALDSQHQPSTPENS